MATVRHQPNPTEAHLMRLPRVRFTVRRMMLAVAIVAVVLEGLIVLGRYRYHRDRAARVARTAVALRRMIAKLPPGQKALRTDLDDEDGSPAVLATPEACEKFLAHLDRVVRKHEYAARHPWLPIEPDPPAPK
jgi:hypothetical protein